MKLTKQQNLFARAESRRSRDIEAKKHECKNVEIPSQNIYFGVLLGFLIYTYKHTYIYPCMCIYIFTWAKAQLHVLHT